MTAAALHVAVDGDGPPLATLHGGLGLDSTYLHDALAPLAAHHQLLHCDVLGHGGSPVPDDWAAVELDTFSDALDATRAARGLSRWSVLGHSYGGILALAYALRHPDRVDRLVLVATGPSFAHAPAALADLERRGHPEAVAALLAGLSAPAESDEHLAAAWPQILPLYFHRWEPRFLAAFARVRYCAAGFNRGNQLLATLDLAPRLAEAQAPALVVTGDDDFIMPAAVGQGLAAGLPAGRFAPIAGAGHFPFLEAPAATLAAIGAFLAA